MVPAKKHKKRLVLLDSHAIIHRAFHALPDFTTSEGVPTGALYGLVTMLIKLFGELKPDHIAACFDLPGATHRHEAFEAYKATRKEIDPALALQLESAKEIFKVFGIPIYSEKGFEADDVLGTIVQQFSDNPDIEIIIASGDMDTLQLVSGEKVKVFTLRKGITDTVLYDQSAVETRFGFGPELIPDYKGLSGDLSDNISGVPGIGEKTATTLIQKFGPLEEIFAALKKDKQKFIEKSSLKERVANSLVEHEDEARFSKLLATIRRDAPVKFSLPEKDWDELVDLSATEELFRRLEFKTLLDRVKTLLVNSKTLESAEPSATNITKAAKESKGATKSAEKGNQNELQKIALALWVVDSNISDPTLDDILNYANTDSLETAREKIFTKLKEGRTRQVYEEIELPLIPVIGQMEKRGVQIDTKYLKKLSKEYHTSLSALEKKIWKAAGEEFNINSPKQLSHILFEKMKLGDIAGSGKGKKTQAGLRSTRESELEKIRGSHPVVGQIVEYRELQKLLSSYIDSIPEKMARDGRLHAHFVQTGTTTGRISSEDPNMQNIPIKTDTGKKIRNAFVAAASFKLVALDYSQIELRIAAFLSGDPKLIEIFKSGGDIHAGVAAHIFKVPQEKVDYDMRRRAKVINFGILYGMGVNALRANLGAEQTSREQARHFYDQYFKNFSGLAAYLEKIKYLAGRDGYTETFFGRRRYFPGLRSKLPYIRAASERMAINAPFQGTSADILKLAMIRVNDFLASEKLLEDVRLVLTVHDELVYEIREALVAKIAPKIRKIMEDVIAPEEMTGVPLVVKAEAGADWGNMKEI